MITTTTLLGGPAAPETDASPAAGPAPLPARTAAASARSTDDLLVVPAGRPRVRLVPEGAVRVGVPRRRPPARADAPGGAAPDRLRALLPTAGWVGVGVAAGLLIAAAGLRAGPLATVLLVLAPVAVVVAWRRPHVVVASAALALPLGQVAVGGLELVQVGAAAVVLVVLGPALLRRDLRLPPLPVAVPLVAFVVIAAASTTQAVEQDLAFRLDVQLVLLVLLTVAVTTAVRTAGQARVVVVALVLGGAGASAWALLDAGPTETFFGGSVVTGRALGIFAQPNELGIFSAVLLVVAVGWGLAGPTPRARRLALVAAAVVLGGLLLSLSRGAWIGALVGLVVLAVLVSATRRRLGVVALVAVVVGGVLGALGALGGVGSRAASIADGAANPYDQRPLIWSEAARLAAEQPVLGHGPGGYTAAAAAEALRDGAYLEADHAHNLLLNVAVEFGVPGVLALLALAVGLVVVARRGASTGPLPAVLLAALAAAAAHGMLDYPLRNPTTITTVWLVMSLLVAASTTPRRTREGTP